MSAITAEHVTKRFGGFEAVSDVSFEVPSGQFLAVLGPNGAGKTTTLEMLEGFNAPTSGTMRVLGATPHRGGRAWRARIGLVLQSTSLDPGLTVRETLAQFAGLYADPRPVGEAIEITDLENDARTKVGVLSGGQRRRVDLAIGIIGRPEVLFLDEPTTALDPEARRHTWAAIENLAATGTTIVLTTHYIDEADQLAARILVLAGGQIVADTTPDGLRAQASPATIRYVLENPEATPPATRPPGCPARPGCWPRRRATSSSSCSPTGAPPPSASACPSSCSSLRRARPAPPTWQATQRSEAAFPTLTLIYFPLVIISGVLFNLSEPSWLNTLVSYLPAQPMIEAAVNAVHHGPGVPFIPVLAAWAVGGLLVAILTFRWEPHRPRTHARTRAH